MTHASVRKGATTVPTSPVDLSDPAVSVAHVPAPAAPATAPQAAAPRATAPRAADPGPRRTTLWTRSPCAQAAILLALSLAVRAPSFRRPFWSPDEGYLATEAVALRHGGRMYTDVVDRKPPLVPWLYEACFDVAGPGSLWLVRLCAVIALAVTAMFVARLAANELGPWAGLPAGTLTVAASVALPAPDAMAATFEIFMLPATAAAMYYGSRRRYLAAGLALAAATLTKQVGLAPLLPLAVQALASPRRSRWRQGTALAAGMLLPVLGCALLLGVRPFVFWVFLSSGSYAASPAGLTAICGHVAGDLLRLALLFAAFAPFLPRLLVRRFPGGFDRSLWLWLLASAAGVSAGFHFYGHYFLQLVPPLALLAVRAVGTVGTARTAGIPYRRPSGRAWPAPDPSPAGVGRALARTRRARGALFHPRLRRTTAVTVGCAVAACGVFTGAALRARPPRMDTSLAVAAAVDARSAPGQSVFVWGMHPEVYWLADRPASSRYLTAGLLTNFSGGADTRRVGARYAVPGAWARFRRELAAAPPCLVVDESAGTPYPLVDYPTLARLVGRGYTRVATVRGTRVYHRAGC
jgi:hypothetical protein